ncbi:GNAT family N-acetyltransferase [Clostridium sp. ATCC 25772]|uniref:GNAT family N-acetyltransferase n=1 Tax=Clostridium sp. ATCC 25772 TaxID=1676991 RepID=UPI000A3EC7D7|nr:GNAT family N-acetyltransferase [Clostridium sp. ATCC 25772]
MNDIKDVLKFSYKDKIRNINIINFIENYPISYIEQIGELIIVKGKSDKKWIYISSKSIDELKIIKSKINYDDKNFAAVEEWMMPILIKGYEIKWRLSTMKLILKNEVNINEAENIMDKLNINDAKFIYENSDYKDVISIDYIINRITKGVNSCIRHIDKPVGWAITQDDGAIGFLHVLSQYRNNGYAHDITIDLINKVRNKNKIPFVHIEEDNLESMKLATSLGFEKYKIVNWFERE